MDGVVKGGLLLFFFFGILLLLHCLFFFFFFFFFFSPLLSEQCRFVSCYWESTGRDVSKSV